MIVDVTNEVYTNLKTSLTGITVLQTFPSTSPTFPCIIIEEISNDINIDTIDTSGDNHCDVSIEINIFSDAENKITEVKTIRGQVDAIMSGQYRMTRGFTGTTPNFLDDNIYRYTIRYSFTIDANKQIYRR